MPNPAGTNQFQGFGIEAPYGDVKRQGELTRSAPISGAPVAGRALNTPRRNQRRATHGPPQPASAPPLAATTVTPQQTQAAWWQQVAALDGVSDTVKALAARAQR